MDMVSVKIVYCDPCRWKSKAEEMSSNLKAVYGDKISVILEVSDGGKFEVFVSGNLIFSRLKAGRFPSLEEIRNEVEKEL